MEDTHSTGRGIEYVCLVVNSKSIALCPTFLYLGSPDPVHISLPTGAMYSFVSRGCWRDPARAVGKEPPLGWPHCLCSSYSDCWEHVGGPLSPEPKGISWAPAPVPGQPMNQGLICSSMSSSGNFPQPWGWHCILHLQT